MMSRQGECTMSKNNRLFAYGCVSALALAATAAATNAGEAGRQYPVPKPTVAEFAQMTASETPPTQAQCISAGRRCFSPQAIQSAYNLSPLHTAGNQGQGITIAIVDSYGSDTMAHDLHVFDNAFGIQPMCGEE